MNIILQTIVVLFLVFLLLLFMIKISKFIARVYKEKNLMNCFSQFLHCLQSYLTFSGYYRHKESKTKEIISQIIRRKTIVIYNFLTLLCSLIFISYTFVQYLSPFTCESFLKVLITCFMIYRSWEILICQLNVLFHTDKEVNPSGYKRGYIEPRRLLFVAILNYFEILFLYAIAYHYFQYLFSVEGLCLNDIFHAIYFSAVTMTTLGYGDIYPIETWGAIITTIHIILSIFLTLMVLSRFISNLDQSKKNCGKINIVF
jgi:positive regulator of sigma E activity